MKRVPGSFLLAGCLVAARLTTGAPVIPASVMDEVSKRVEHAYATAITVGVMDETGTTYFSRGSTDPEGGHPVGEDTLFEIGSVSKTMTGIVLSDMAARGEIGLTNLIQDYLPTGVVAPRFGTRDIQVVHLATHFSGLPRMSDNLDSSDPGNPYAGATIQGLYDFLETVRLARAPGAQYEYSNFGVALLGQILARRAAMEFEDLLRTRLTEVVGLPDTVIHLSPDQEARLAQPFNGVVRSVPWDLGAYNPAGGIRSTARDMMRYVAANMGLIETPLYEAMTNAHRPRFTIGGTTQIGLNWFRATANGQTVVFHDGQTGSYSALAGFEPRARRAVVVLTTGWGVAGDLGMHLLWPNVQGLTPYPVPARWPEEALRKYQGLFVRGAESFRFTVQRGYLTFAYSGDGGLAFTLYPWQTDRFRAPPGIPDNASAQFRTNATGRIGVMRWTQGGVTRDFARRSIPVRVHVERGDAGVAVSVTGEGDLAYVVESSSDLAEWTPVGTRTIWDEPLVDTWREGEKARFYRAREP